VFAGRSSGAGMSGPRQMLDTVDSARLGVSGNRGPLDRETLGRIGVVLFLRGVETDTVPQWAETRFSSPSEVMNVVGDQTESTGFWTTFSMSAGMAS